MKLKDIPIKEIISDLTSINLVELEDRCERFFHVPTPTSETQILLPESVRKNASITLN